MYSVITRVAVSVLRVCQLISRMADGLMDLWPGLFLLVCYQLSGPIAAVVVVAAKGL